MPTIVQCPDISQIPSMGGSYALLLSLNEEKSLQIGKLGQKHFPAGWYIYFGNAFGSGGLFSRISHHLRISGNPFWHVDWFRMAARPEEVFFSTSAASLECKWCLIIASNLKGEVLIKGFGSSDCRNGCGSHLLFLKTRPDHQELTRNLKLPLGGEDQLFQCSITD